MTCSAVDPESLARIRRRIFLALFVALAVALRTFEYLLPSPAPWFRPGFANIFTLAALFLYGGRAAWTVTLARVVIAALVVGSLFSPGFFLSLAGGVCAVTLMTGAHALAGRHLGPVGISVLGALGHVSGQLVVAWLLLVRSAGLWHLYPVFVLFALGAGVVNGIAADLLLELLRAHPAFAAAFQAPSVATSPAEKR
jgi:heptaprenyl diphosphate synthase